MLAAIALAMALAGHNSVRAQQVAEPAPPPAVPPPVPLGRLPDTVRPLAYRLDLTIDPKQARFSGKVEIDARLNAPARVIFLHGRNLAMHRAIAMIGGKPVAGAWREADPTGVAALTFPRPLPAGPITFAFDYDAPFNDSPAGMFRVKVGDDWYSWTQFESIDARSAFPSFDEPGFKTPFAIILRTRPGQAAISNAPEASATLEGGLEVHRFQPTLPLPTYLVAMMTGPFATVQGAAPPTPQRDRPLPLRIVSTRPNAAQLAFALEGTKSIVARLEDYFGEPFPFPKLDQITTPVLPGAMENAGADLYDDSILVMSDAATPAQKREFGMVVAHELSHQWFGDLVTPAWWDDIWLNESFANWMGYRVGQEWRPDLNISAGALAEGFAAMDTDALVAGRPIRQKIETNAQVDGAFDSITYGKGGQVVAMIASFMGDGKFRDGVRRYLAAHRYGNATSTDFFAALAEVAGDPRIVPAMQSFTDQQGVPLLTFARRGGAYIVTQSRYAPLGATAPAARWGVPLCFRKGAARQCTLLTQESARLVLDGPGPLIPNSGGTGYYRFELSRPDWDALIAQADRLPGGEALATADSLLASFRAGRAATDQLAALATKLVRNPDSHAFGASGSIMAALVNGELIDPAAMPAYRAFVARLFRPELRHLGFDPRAGAYAREDSEISLRRAQAVGRMSSAVRDRTLRHLLDEAARKFIGGDASALDPAWYGDAFEAYLAGGGIAAAKILAGKALASQDPYLRPAALEAVAASGSAPIANWLLNEFKDERLRPSEQRDVLRGVIGTSATREVGYSWLRSHLDELLSGNGGIFFAARLPQLLGGFCSVGRADEFTRELRPRFAGKAGALELERAIERVRNCGALRDARMVEVSNDIYKMR